MKHTLAAVLIVAAALYSVTVNAEEPKNPPPTYPSVTPHELQKFLSVPQYNRPLWFRILTEDDGCKYSGILPEHCVCWHWL